MLVHTVRILHSELLSSVSSRCSPAVWHRFINTSGIKEDLPAASVVSQGKEVPYEEVIREKEIKIHTCGKLYQKWRSEKRYWTVPKSDLTFDVKYIDTGCSDKRSFKPTVVSLHGSPGNYKEFFPVISHLYKKGVRVIAPNFPGSDNIQPTKFRHTPEEKAEFVRDFLRALRVPSVDLILCHSSALFPGLHLSLENKSISVNSLALINPTGLDIPRLLRPVWLTKPLVRLSEFPLGYKLTETVGRRLAKKPELKGGSFEEHFLSAFTLLHSSIPEVRDSSSFCTSLYSLYGTLLLSVHLCTVCKQLLHFVDILVECIHFNPLGYKLTETVGRRLAKKPELKGGSFEEHFFSAFTLLHSSIPEQVVPFQALLNQNFPVLLAFSYNDKLISKKTSYKMAEMMVDMKDVIIYDKEGKAHGSGGINPFRKVMAFEKGSHFLFRTYPDIICEAISSFLFHQVENRVK
ncbi:uncharacterized protein LOC129980663 [Argiope bruennichi]|uniref:uncharacterized protein LOC129980663 n=1 Tax=Argiope bruennichi TaxID=94029 RepID=UPI002494C4AE|nr:uncharacterized protein LOC129980663 [Argiope bruennichi]